MHTSEIDWAFASQRVSLVAGNLLDVLNNAEEAYQELLEAYSFAGGTDNDFAELLFQTATPDQVQIDKARDLRLAMVAAHDLYEAMTNQVISQGDRAAALRRLS